jgi:hypothetical protein
MTRYPKQTRLACRVRPSYVSLSSGRIVRIPKRVHHEINPQPSIAEIKDPRL